jgi:hypothetical protein
MATSEEIEREIRQLLATETRTTVLSNKLFQQGTGLFAQLGKTEAERREIVKSELFRTAQARVRELQYRDAEALREAHRVVQERLPDTDVRLSLDFPAPAAS